MKNKLAHEPKSKVMSAAETWEDARELASLLRENLVRAEPAVRVRVPLSAFLAALDELNQEELTMLHRRVEEHLTAVR